jgi:4a-hydroxytetrahydrobiopterin dehydratase
MDKMTDEQVDAALKSVPEWGVAGDAIQRTFSFKDFVESMKFVNQVADQAEADQHHPDVLIRWNKVTLTLSTHDASGITEKDFKLASKADGFARMLSPAVKAGAPTGAGAVSGGKSASGASKKAKKG